MSFGMMAGMLPPGVQQLLDSMPTTEQMKEASRALLETGTESGEHTEVGNFLEQLAQLLIQNGLVEESKQQTEALKLVCPACKKDFAVDNAFQYRRRVEEGFLYACADEHPVTVIGSGTPGGDLSPDEQLTFENEANVIVIYPKDYAPSDDSGN